MRERETDSCINSAQAKLCESNFTLLYFCWCLIERVEAYSILKKNSHILSVSALICWIKVLLLKHTAAELLRGRGEARRGAVLL